MQIKKIFQKTITFSFFILSIFIGVFVSFIALQQDITMFNLETFVEASADWIERYPAMLFAFFLVLIIVFTAGLRIHILMKVKRRRTRFIDSLVYGILARYYVLITPWGLGGQPITIAMMLKKNIPFGLAVATPMIDLLFMRVAMTVIGAIALLNFGHLVDGYILFFSVIGYFFTSILPILMIIFTISPKFEMLIVQLIEQYWPLKTRHKTVLKIQTISKSYRDAFAVFKAYPFELFQVVLLSFMSQIALLSIPYFVMMSFNFSPSIEDTSIVFNYLNITAMVTIATVILGTIPTIGSAGAAEFTFVSVFSIFLSGNYLFWTTFIWRFFVFYLWLFIGVFITTIQGIFARREQRRHHVPKFEKPLKVFLFHEYFYPIIDDSVKALDAYAKYLVNQGVDVTVVAPFYGNKANFTYPIVSIQIVKFIRKVGRFPYFFFRRAYQRKWFSQAPTIYHSFTPFKLGNDVLKMGALNNVPVVLTLHHRYQDHGVLGSNYPQKLNRLIPSLKRYEAIFINDKTFAPLIKEHRILENKLIQVEEGTTYSLEKDLHYQRQLIHKKFNLSDTIVTLIVDIKFNKEEDHSIILNTLRDFDLSGVAFQLLIIGSGSEEKKAKLEWVFNHPQSKIIFLGDVTDSLVRSGYFSSADILLIQDNRGVITPLMQEAMAHQRFICLPYHSMNATWYQPLNYLLFAEKKATSYFDLIQGITRKKAKIGKDEFLMGLIQWEHSLRFLPSFYEKLLKEFYQIK